MTMKNGIVRLAISLCAGVSMTAHATPQQAQCHMFTCQAAKKQF
jgi:hypothetical protein